MSFLIPSGGMSANYRNAIVWVVVAVVGLITYRFLERNFAKGN